MSVYTITVPAESPVIGLARRQVSETSWLCTGCALAVHAFIKVSHRSFILALTALTEEKRLCKQEDGEAGRHCCWVTFKSIPAEGSKEK